jgi:hypothetical protein
VADCATPDTTASVADTTCNGDGNGYLTSGGHEPFRAWQHLLAAKLIQGQYTGIGPAAIGSTVPKSNLEATGFSWVGGQKQVNNAVSADANYYDGDYTNMLAFGALATITDAAALKPEDMYGIDMKFDDGVPSTGGVRVYKSSVNCVASATTYNVSYASAACAPLFLSSFKAAK